MRLPSHLLFLLLLVGAAAVADAAEPPTSPDLAELILVIAETEAAELARLESALATAEDRGTILSLQNCVTHVKLASRLALYEVQLSAKDGQAAMDNPDLQGRLEAMALDLRDRLGRLEPELPEGYAFDPLASLAEEVLPCAE
jgi:hypothetical protein